MMHLIGRVFLILQLFKVTDSFAQQSHSVDVYAPPGFRWEWTKIDAATLAIDLKRLDGGPTEVKFQWNQNPGNFTSKTTEDKTENVAVPKPGRRIWMPHVGQMRSLEALYIEVLQDLGYRNLQVPYLQQDQNGSIKISDIDSFLEVATKQERRMKLYGKLAFSNLNEKTKASTQATLTDLIKEIPLKPPGEDLRYVLAQAVSRLGLDPIEPISSHSGPTTGEASRSESRIDAFNLTPLQMFEVNPEGYYQQVLNLSQNEGACPGDFMNHETIEWKMREAVMVLLTHNHRTEFLAYKAAALKLGIKRGWIFTEAVNNLYEKDRQCWLKTIGAESKSLSATRLEMAGLKVKMKSGYEIPQQLVYHYYGAKILAKRLQSMGLPPKVVKSLNSYLGAKYKSITIPGSPIAKLYEEIYFEAAKEALELK